ncbi:hypothetical protein Aperf_G00000126616 [Anoplocephala perfoliata]
MAAFQAVDPGSTPGTRILAKWPPYPHRSTAAVLLLSSPHYLQQQRLFSHHHICVNAKECAPTQARMQHLHLSTLLSMRCLPSHLQPPFNRVRECRLSSRSGFDSRLAHPGQMASLPASLHSRSPATFLTSLPPTTAPFLPPPHLRECERMCADAGANATLASIHSALHEMPSLSPAAAVQSRPRVQTEITTAVSLVVPQGSPHLPRVCVPPPNSAPTAPISLPPSTPTAVSGPAIVTHHDRASLPADREAPSALCLPEPPPSRPPSGPLWSTLSAAAPPSSSAAPPACLLFSLH